MAYTLKQTILSKVTFFCRSDLYKQSSCEHLTILFLKDTSCIAAIVLVYNLKTHSLIHMLFIQSDHFEQR